MIDSILQRGCYKQRESNLSQVNTCLPSLGGKADIAKGPGHKIQLIIKECCENSDGKSKSKKPSGYWQSICPGPGSGLHIGYDGE